MAAEPFLGQLKYVSFNFAPKGWALCNGQTLPINQNQALFSLLGTSYGGNGQTTFQLPDMRSRVPIHQSQGGNGLSTYGLGQKVGAEANTLTTSTLPQHTHTLVAAQDNGLSQTPNQVGGAMLANAVSGGNSMVPDIYIPSASAGATVNLAAQSLTTAGSASPTPYPTIQPYLTVICCIALQGIFPSPN